jgi:hypothetical protein
MNKKLIVLIVALECVFSIFLISIFGPMLEMLHTPAAVTEIHVLDENGKPVERGTVIELDSDARSYELTWEVLPDDAENPELAITAFIDDVEITDDTENPPVRITKNADGTTTLEFTMELPVIGPSDYVMTLDKNARLVKSTLTSTVTMMGFTTTTVDDRTVEYGDKYKVYPPADADAYVVVNSYEDLVM